MTINKQTSAIPEKFPSRPADYRTNVTYIIEEMQFKEKWMKRGMYAFVSNEWVKPLAKWIGDRKVLEVMAGAGWLAAGLRENGVNLVATDDHSWSDGKWEMQTEVLQLSANDAVAQHGKEADILLISWPYMDNYAYQCIFLWKQQKSGRLIIYIGEKGGGCTADPEFFEHFEELNDESFEQVENKYRSWWGIRDTVQLGKFV